MTAPNGQPTADLIEVWGDRTSLRSLCLALAISTVSTALAAGIAALTHESLFFWGLGGAVFGFIVSSIALTPQRDVTIMDDDSIG